jgi:hypothetical protein
VRRLARHLRGNAVAYLAIFVGLGGTSYAAVTIPKNSVGNKQLKKDAVDTKKVKNGTLLKDDFKGTLPAGPQGPGGGVGEKGAPGGQGAKGDQGDKGVGGDQGFPGSNLTPSQGANSAPTPATTLGATDTPLITAPAVVTTAANTRLLAAAGGTAGGDDTVVDCVLNRSTNGGAKAAMGQRVATQIATLGFFPGYLAPIAAQGSADVPPGSHVVTLECNDGASVDGFYIRGNLHVGTAAP